MKPIGGFFELELRKGREYHTNAIRLNLGRAAFEYMLTARKYKKVYLPYYLCDVMLQPMKRLGIESDFYIIDENLEPIFDMSKIGRNEGFLYINYFGLKDKFIRKLERIAPRLIIDNAQAFYSRQKNGVDVIYSARKFFGVADGAYLYSNATKLGVLKQDISSGRFSHLINRIERGPEVAYKEFKRNEELHNNSQLMQMSRITRRILQSLDYGSIAKKRKDNYAYLDKYLYKTNMIKIEIKSQMVPFAYPYLTEKRHLRNKLINNKIYVPQFWKNVMKACNKNSWEFFLAKNIMPLPIDQRYCKEDMKRILDIIIA